MDAEGIGCLYVQEYSRYFGMKCIVLSGGCLTGSRHRGAKLHGFLSYLIKTAVAHNSYTIFGYKGKQVRDNLHATDIGVLISKIYEKTISTSPPVFPIVANLCVGRTNSVSVLEVIDILDDSFGLKLDYDISTDARIGVINCTSLIIKHSNFDWMPSHSIHSIIDDIISDS